MAAYHVGVGAGERHGLTVPGPYSSALSAAGSRRDLRLRDLDAETLKLKRT
jgi:hypothetical protein